MKIEPIFTTGDAFGFHSTKQLSKKAEMLLSEKPNKKQKKVIYHFSLIKNCTTFIGYIPIIGTIAAIAKIVLSYGYGANSAPKEDIKATTYESQESENEKKFAQGIREFSSITKIRSFFELTSLGFLLIVPDLIVTIGRHFSENSLLFGFHSNEQFIKEITGSAELKNLFGKDEDDLNLANKIKNISNAVGYIPIIGTIAAIGKLIAASSFQYMLKRSTTSKLDETAALLEKVSSFKVRSCFELTSLGFLLAIPDLITTIGRRFSKQST